MGEILEFPSQQAQGLAYLDRQLRQLLTAKGSDADTIDFAACALTLSSAPSGRGNNGKKLGGKARLSSTETARVDADGGVSLGTKTCKPLLRPRYPN